MEASFVPCASLAWRGKIQSTGFLAGRPVLREIALRRKRCSTLAVAAGAHSGNSLVKIAEQVRSGERTALEVTEEYLQRATADDEKYNHFISIDAEGQGLHC